MRVSFRQIEKWINLLVGKPLTCLLFGAWHAVRLVTNALPQAVRLLFRVNSLRPASC
jgi:hypothetical protein